MGELDRLIAQVVKDHADTTTRQELDDTFGPNPCRRMTLRNEDTGHTFGVACDSKRCPDCGPRKARLFYESARSIGEVGYVHTYKYKAEVDAVLERAKKAKQRNGTTFTYLVVGDDELGFILWTDTHIDSRLRRMSLRDWKDRLLHAWKYADRRLRRSQGLQRLSLVAYINRRATRDTSWKPVFRRLLSMRELGILEQERRDLAFAEENGWQVWDEDGRLRSTIESNRRFRRV